MSKTWFREVPETEATSPKREYGAPKARDRWRSFAGGERFCEAKRFAFLSGPRGRPQTKLSLDKRLVQTIAAVIAYYKNKPSY